MGRFKGELRCKRWVNSILMYEITEINYIHTISISTM